MGRKRGGQGEVNGAGEGNSGGRDEWIELGRGQGWQQPCTLYPILLPGTDSLTQIHLDMRQLFLPCRSKYTHCADWGLP